MIIKQIVKFFDKLEDKVRGRLSKYPILYAFIGSVGIILLWRGIWQLADMVNMSGLVSAILGTTILLMIGLFVSFFVGEQIIISGINKEKKTDEKTEEEIREESVTLTHIHADMDKIKTEIQNINEKLKRYLNKNG